MKVIKYTLTGDGTIPDYVTDGGYFLIYTQTEFPQNFTVIGIATDDAPESAIATKVDLQKYTKDIPAIITIDGENPTMAEFTSIWWDTKVTW